MVRKRVKFLHTKDQCSIFWPCIKQVLLQYKNHQTYVGYFVPWDAKLWSSESLHGHKIQEGASDILWVMWFNVNHVNLSLCNIKLTIAALLSSLLLTISISVQFSLKMWAMINWVTVGITVSFDVTLSIYLCKSCIYCKFFKIKRGCKFCRTISYIL